MKMYYFPLLAMAFITTAVYGEPIDLGCNGRGPLAALDSSATFRKAIGEANPANFLSSVYDSNGQQISPESAKSLHCPLFIDSNSEPSASASMAILRAGVRVRAAEPEEQSTAAAPNQPIMVLAAAGVVAQFQQPEIQKSETQEEPQAAPPAKAGRIQHRQVSIAASVLGLEKQQLQPETSKPSHGLEVHASAVPSSRQVVEKSEQHSAAAQFQKSPVLSFAEATGLLRQSRTGDSEAPLEFNPVMVLFDFVALFTAVLSCCLLVFDPGIRTPAEHQRRADMYRAALGGIDLRQQQPVQAAPGRASAVPAQVSALMFRVGH